MCYKYFVEIDTFLKKAWDVLGPKIQKSNCKITVAPKTTIGEDIIMNWVLADVFEFLKHPT